MKVPRYVLVLACVGIILFVAYNKDERQFPRSISYAPNTKHLLPSRDNAAETLVAYAYFESQTGRGNAAYFFSVGVQPYINSTSVHFLFIMTSDISIDLPVGTNIFIHKRRNVGMDICGWNETFTNPAVVKSITGQEPSKYKNIIWMNTSVRGPILPMGLSFESWLPYFTNQITKRDKLIGTTINCLNDNDRDIFGNGPPFRYGRAHLQSMFLVFDSVILPVLLKYTPCSGNVIDRGEIMLTRGVLMAGYGIRPQMLPYRGVDFTNPAEHDAACDADRKAHPDAPAPDRTFPNQYYGFSLHPLELVFFKSNRGILDNELNHYSDWNLRVAEKMYSYRPNYRKLIETKSTGYGT